MKKIVTVSLFVSMSVLAGILIAGYLVSQQESDSSTTGKVGSQTGTTTQGQGASPTILSVAEVAKHGSTQDCWVIIGGKAYDVTAYIEKHPGGAQAITSFCGKDATSAFSTKGEGKGHSDFARKLLENYLVGNLEANASGTPATTGTAAVSNATEVAKHGTPDSCWLIISSAIYDVTDYLGKHPAGAEAITPYCGKEATAAFSTKGEQGNNHSDSAWKMLEKFNIGTLVQ